MKSYFRDPVFRWHDPLGQYWDYLNFRYAIDHNVVIRWADGYHPHELQQLKTNQQILFTNVIFLDPGQYRDHIHSVRPFYYGMMYHDYDVTSDAPIEKEFNAFSNRFDLFRQSWFYHIVRRLWLDRGYISFNCDTSHSVPDESYSNLSAAETFQKGFRENNQIFDSEHVNIMNMIPFKNFDDTGDLTAWIMRSKFSLVFETWFHDNNQITFSEKTMRVLQMPRPWLLMTTKLGVAHLRSWGFDVMDDIIDHSYDRHDSAVDRQLAILEQAEHLMTLDFDQIKSRCVQAALHNQDLMRRWHDQWFTGMDQELQELHHKAQRLRRSRINLS